MNVESLNKCTDCGLCRQVCPVFRVLKDETVSPRAKNNIAKHFDKNKDKIDKEFFYQYCNWCEACVEICPVGVGFDAIKVREEIVSIGYVSKENKDMVENIKQYGTPFGKVDNIDKSNPPDKLYCC